MSLDPNSSVFMMLMVPPLSINNMAKIMTNFFIGIPSWITQVLLSRVGGRLNSPALAAPNAAVKNGGSPLSTDPSLGQPGR